MIRSHPAPLALLAATLVASACAPASGHQRAGATPRRSPAVAVDRRVDSLLSLMTLEEKLGQLNLLSVDGDTVSPEQGELIRKGLVGGLLNLTGADATRRVQRLAVEQSRLKVPLIFGYDVIHGYRTTFPIPLAEASTDRKSTRLNSSHSQISYAVFCLKKKNKQQRYRRYKS